MKHILKTLILILIPFISFSQSLGKSGGKTRIAPTTQIRKGTKPRQVLMTRVSDSSLVYADLDTILQNNIRNTDIKHIFSVVGDSIRIDSFNNVLGVIVGSPQYIDNVVNKDDLIQGAINDLRVEGTNILRGSDSPTDAKSSQFTSDIYNHMVGNKDVWVGNSGYLYPTAAFFPNGTVEFGANGNHATENSLHYYNGSLSVGRGNTFLYALNMLVGRDLHSYNDYNAMFGGISSVYGYGCTTSGFNHYSSVESNYTFATGQLHSFLNYSGWSFASGSNHTFDNSKYSFATGRAHELTGDYQFTQGWQNKNNTYGGILLGIGGSVSNWSGQTSSSWVNTDYHFRLNRITELNNSANQSSVIILKNGFTQINTDLNNNNNLLQSQMTPHSAFEVVSNTSGFLAPRMTELELTNFMSTLNLTTDVTGGVDGNLYCKKGMQIECTDCTSIDGSTQGVTVKLYPNTAVTAWIAKKLW